MSDEQRDPSWDADPATPEQMHLVERVCTGLGFEGYFDTTCGWWRNEWNRPVFVPVVRSIALAYELGRLDQSDLRNAAPRSQPEEVPADGYVTITTNEAGECVAVTRNDEDGRVLSVLWKRRPAPRGTPQAHGAAPQLAHEPDTYGAALEAIRACLQKHNEDPNGPIRDTIWYGNGETLFDFIDSALQAAKPAAVPDALTVNEEDAI